MLLSNVMSMHGFTLRMHPRVQFQYSGGGLSSMHHLWIAFGIVCESNFYCLHVNCFNSWYVVVGKQALLLKNLTRAFKKELDVFCQVCVTTKNLFLSSFLRYFERRFDPVSECSNQCRRSTYCYSFSYRYFSAESSCISFDSADKIACFPI